MTPEFKSTVTRLIKDAHPNVTAKQTEGILAHVATKAELTFYTKDTSFNDMAELHFKWLIEKAVEQSPRFVSAVPSVVQLVDIAAAEAKANNREFGAEHRITLARELQGLSDDERLDKLPNGFKVDAITTATPAVPTTAKSYASMTVDELDDVVRQKLGFEPHQLLASQRANYHAEFRKLAPVATTPVTDQAKALNRAESTLSPADRITAHREKLRVK